MQFSTVPLVGACVAGLMRYRRLETTRRYLVWLSRLALLITAVAAWFSSHHRPNLFLAPLDTAIELTLLALMYRRALWPLAVGRYLPLGMSLFLLGTILSYSPRLDTAKFSPVQHFIESVAVLALAGRYLWQLLQPPPHHAGPAGAGAHVLGIGGRDPIFCGQQPYFSHQQPRPLLLA